MEKEKLSTNPSSSPPMSYITSSPPPNWKTSSGMDVQLGELNFLSDQLPSCFLNLNWENSMDRSVQLESALSSIVSSPAASNAAANPAERVMIRELIGRLGSIPSFSGEFSPSSQAFGGSSNSYIGGNNYSTDTSCYSTPLNSPPKLNLSMMDHHLRGNLPISGNSIAPHPSFTPLSSDPGFAERAAKFSCFSSGNLGGLPGQFEFPEPELPYRSAPRVESGKLSRVSSSQSLKAGSQKGSLENKEIPLQDGIGSDRKFSRLSRPSTPDNAEFSNAREESSNSGQNTCWESASNGPNQISGRKRKAGPKTKLKDLPSSSSAKDAAQAMEENGSNPKRCKPIEATGNENDEVKPKSEESSDGDAGEDGKRQREESSKPPEPPKQDYIHVRARRGQATDSHSLAERVRREKISERMKFLQDLVPGCNKVTGKAVMLDEIINYVQSLQRQVEFLSMKLATINPRLDINMDTLLSKDTVYPFDSSAAMHSYGHQPQLEPLTSIVSNGSDYQCSVNPLDATLRRALSMQMSSIDGFGDAASLVTSLWDDDLQSVVQMGFGDNPEIAFPSQKFHGPLSNGHMKNEP